MKKHAHWCTKNCNNDPDNLRASLLNAVEHYKKHKKNKTTRRVDSRCGKDQNYEASKVILQSQITERIMTNALNKSILYRNAEDYCMTLDIYFFERFNNMLNIFHAKRISFGTKQYRLRSDLILQQWNVNVDRP